MCGLPALPERPRRRWRARPGRSRSRASPACAGGAGGVKEWGRQARKEARVTRTHRLTVPGGLHGAKDWEAARVGARAAQGLGVGAPAGGSSKTVSKMMPDHQGRTWALKMGRNEPAGTSWPQTCASEASTASEIGAVGGHGMGQGKFESTRSVPDEQLLKKPRSIRSIESILITRFPGWHSGAPAPLRRVVCKHGMVRGMGWRACL